MILVRQKILKQLQLSFRKLYISVLIGASTMTISAETVSINVGIPGQLNLSLIDAPAFLDTLKITGTLDNTDLKLLSTGNGILKTVHTLDISNINCVENEDEPYNTIDRVRFFFSSQEYSEYVIEPSDPTIVHDTSYTYLYSRSLGGVFTSEAPYKEVILPSFAYPAMSAFSGNSNIEKITFKSAPMEIGEKAFFDCKALKSVNISPEIKEISANAFCGCTELSLPMLSPISVGEGAFRGAGIRHINLSKVNKLGASAFSGSKLEGEINLSSTDTIPVECFYGVSGITNIKFSPTIKWIDREAFYGSNLSEIKFPESLEYIGCLALGYYHTKISPKVPEGGIYYVANIAYACDYANLPANVVIKPGTKAISGQLFKHCATIKSIQLPKGLKHIGNQAFYFAENLESINFPEGLEGIHDEAFSMASKLNVPPFPSSLRHVGSHAFSNCQLLSELTLPSSIESIGVNAFKDCHGITRIYYDVFDSKTKEFGSIFNGEGLQKITIGPNAKILPAIDAPNLLIIDSKERPENGTSFEMKHFGSEKLISVTLPSTTISLPESIFSNCQNLTSLTFTGENKTESFIIGDNALWNTSSLENFDMPKGVIEIGDFAFSGSGLLSINLPSTVKKMGMAPFSGCLNNQEMFVVPAALEKYEKDNGRREGSFCEMGVKNITVPANMADKGLDFNALPNINSIILEGYAENVDISTYQSNFKELVLPEGVKIINGEIMSNAINSFIVPDGVEQLEFLIGENLTDVSLPATCVSIGSIEGKKYSLNIKWRIPEDYTYEGNTNSNAIKRLREVTGSLILPEGVGILGDIDHPNLSVTNCDLSKIVLPSTLTQLCDKAFYGCTYPEITCYAKNPPTLFGYETVLIHDNINSGYLRGNLYVPAESVEKYKASGFRNFNIYPIQEENTSIDKISSTTSHSIKGVYTIDGKKLSAIPSEHGTYIVVYDNGSTSKITK